MSFAFLASVPGFDEVGDVGVVAGADSSAFEALDGDDATFVRRQYVACEPIAFVGAWLGFDDGVVEFISHDGVPFVGIGGF
jgi:hypothetical protein